MTEGRSIGPWEISEKLGEGGNADVFRATDAQGREVALKVIHAVKAQKEPYRRFIREIEVLRRLKDAKGILPLIDAYLPEAPSKDDRPWLAMPVAIPIADALRGQPLEAVVEAVAAIAAALAWLHEQDLGHRDIKPGNLYIRGGEWLVGDFGLVAVPDVEELTLSGRPLGPAYYTPYEMVVNPATADPKAADVYSLGKTLWILATGQNFPPQGHQPAGTRGLQIADGRPHPNAQLLDALIDRCTRHHPAERPTMAEVANDLRRWLELPEETKAIDIESVRKRLTTKIQPRLAAADLEAQRRELAYAAAAQLTAQVAHLNRALKDLHPHAQIDGSADKFTRNIVRTQDEMSNSRNILWRYQRRSSITVGDKPMEFELCFSRTLELADDGDMVLFMAIYVDYVELNGMSYRWLPDAWAAPVGSVEAEKVLRDAVSEATIHFKEAAEAFADNLPD
ncbi:MAG: protein kinase domain-containing protein [Candidatus Limnocylindrales bacterium]